MPFLLLDAIVPGLAVDQVPHHHHENGGSHLLQLLDEAAAAGHVPLLRCVPSYDEGFYFY
jgi:hypothetical protein